MNYFDESVMKFVNSFSRVSDAFDYLMSLLIRDNFIKSGILVTILWWFWFRGEKNKGEAEDKSCNKTKTNKKGNKDIQIQRNKQVSHVDRQLHERIVLTMVSCLVAIVVGRFLAFVLPFRLRPLHEIDLNFITPYGINPNALGSWSSFPSDHAVLFFTLATGIFLISRIIGMLVAIYIIVIICFPRIYCGFHYPTDIIAGALIGMVIGWFVITTNVNKYITRPAMLWLNKWPGSFYACFFILTYQIGTMFDSVRGIATYIMCLFKPV